MAVSTGQRAVTVRPDVLMCIPVRRNPTARDGRFPTFVECCKRIASRYVLMHEKCALSIDKWAMSKFKGLGMVPCILGAVLRPVSHS
jgi:hypothetical protein